MHRFWDPVIRTLLEKLEPQGIVEIGCGEGQNTLHLAEFCREHGARLDVIDPEPKFDLTPCAAMLGGRFTLRRARSLEAIPELGRFDVIFVDGDHNWYTVYRELELIESRRRALGQPFPLTLLHDVAWPYGRRDVYYDPRSIPAEFRQPYRVAGILPGVDELIDGGGINRDLYHADHESGERNGVLTAVEDFLRDRASLEFLELPVLHGLGIVVPRSLAERNAAAHGYAMSLRAPEPVVEILRIVEAKRLESDLDWRDARRELAVARLRRRAGGEAGEKSAETSEERATNLIALADELDQLLASVATSKRWKLGDAFRSIIYRPLLKAPGPTLLEMRDAIRRKFEQCEARRVKESRVAPGNGGAARPSPRASASSTKAPARPAARSLGPSPAPEAPTAPMPPERDFASLDTDPARRLYLDLMKRCLINLIYRDQGHVRRRVAPFDLEARMEGRDWPVDAHSMSGWRRLENLQYCVEDILGTGVPGDLIEAGVWRGGATIFMRAILKAYRVSDRRVWVADSFAGLPAPDAEKYPEDAGDRHHTAEQLAVSLEEVRENFSRYDLLDSQVEFLEGWFRDTLPGAPIDRLALVRLDGDMYGSTIEGFESLYPRLSPGGWLIVDDYGASPTCRKAIEDLRRAHGISDEMHAIDWTGVCWRKS